MSSPWAYIAYNLSFVYSRVRSKYSESTCGSCCLTVQPSPYRHKNNRSIRGMSNRVCLDYLSTTPCAIVLAHFTEIPATMDCLIQSTTTPSKDTIDRVQQYQSLLMEIEELGRQKEEHIKRQAVCEGIVEEKKRTVKTINDRKTEPSEKIVRSMQANLDDYKHLVMRHLNNIKNLQSCYSELILGLLKNADLDWLHSRRKTLLTAFNLAQEIDTLIMRKSGHIIPQCQSKRRLVRGYRGGLRSCNRRS